MEISDQRYQELMESIWIRQGGRDSVRLADRLPRKQAPSIATHNETKRIEHQEPDPPKARTAVAREVKEILLVDPEPDRLLAAQNALRLLGDVSVYSEFRAARAQLLARPPDLLVTNLQLQAYNGLHLVHLTEGTPTRCIVYGTYDDRFLAQEVLSAGAFYEHSERLPRALASYVHAVLPPHDRRDPSVLDRRQTSRGGRRCSDL
jgi:CheY-like chemotaxis protein